MFSVKVGAPDCMDMEAAKVPNTTGAPGRQSCVKAMPTDDPLFKKGMIRADGRKIHDLYLLQAKGPSESKSKYDLVKVVAKIPGDAAFRPLADGKCPLVN